MYPDIVASNGVNAVKSALLVHREITPSLSQRSPWEGDGVHIWPLWGPLDPEWGVSDQNFDWNEVAGLIPYDLNLFVTG